MLTQSWRSKSAVFRMYHALTLNGNSKFINAVKRQRNLGLCQHQFRFGLVLVVDKFIDCKWVQIVLNHYNYKQQHTCKHILFNAIHITMSILHLTFLLVANVKTNHVECFSNSDELRGLECRMFWGIWTNRGNRLLTGFGSISSVHEWQ